MVQMPFSESPVSGLRLCMAMFAGLAFLMGVTLAVEGNTSMALTNLCGTLFFIFAWFNPTMLEAHGFMKASIAPEDVVQKKYLWAALAVGILALIIEFKAHLPLG